MPAIGDFGVRPVPGQAGRLIRFGQWLNGDGYADFEHAFVYVGNDQIIEARPSGAGYASVPNAAAWYTCPAGYGVAVAAEAVKLVGVPYSWEDYFALAATRFGMAHLSGALKAYVADTGHMICSQLVDYAYLQAGVHLFSDGRVPGDVTPGDLYGLIVAQRAAQRTAT